MQKLKGKKTGAPEGSGQWANLSAKPKLKRKEYE